MEKKKVERTIDNSKFYSSGYIRGRGGLSCSREV